VKRSYRSRHASGVTGWGPAMGWGQPLSGWSPLVDDGSLPVRVAGSIARWWWPTLALAGFGAVVGLALGHDDPGPNLSTRGLLTMALAAVVVALLTIRRTAGPGALARATAEYAVVALLATLLALPAGVDQQQANPATSSAKNAPTAKPNVHAGEGRYGVLRVAVGVARAVSKAIRAVTGAVGWLADLWRQADQQTDHPSRSPSTTRPTPKGEAMPLSPALASTSSRRPL
jgi:hypothetical protein